MAVLAAGNNGEDGEVTIQMLATVTTLLTQGEKIVDFGGTSLHHRTYMNILLWKTYIDAAALADVFGTAAEAAVKVVAPAGCERK